MAATTSLRQDWIFANPWFWASSGLLLCGVSWVMTQVYADEFRVILASLGIFCSGFGIMLRYRIPGPAALQNAAPRTRQAILGGLIGMFSLVALAMLAVVVTSFFRTDIPWKPGNSIAVAVIVVPLCVAALLRTLKRLDATEPITRDEEAGVLLIIAALCCFITSWTLYRGADYADEWDTLRMFLFVLMSVCLIAAPLAVASVRTRKIVVSLLVLFHFGGIATATLAAPPSPWLIQQIWMRLYRPYLEFMYLNNAYHFYSPEPGPASYLWFRVIYQDKDGKEYGYWDQLPRVDAKGEIKHSTSLEYQRFLAFTEGFVPSEPTPPATIFDSSGQMVPAPFFERRAKQLPQQGVVVGVQAPKMPVPFSPAVPHLQQYAHPTLPVRVMLASVARKIALTPHPETPQLTFKAVKIYRVVHVIAPVGPFVNLEIDARDPEFYRPYYLGQYDKDGNLMDPDDPFLYWMLPIVRDNINDPNSAIRNYAMRHAGDPAWFRPAGQKGWVWVPPGN